MLRLRFVPKVLVLTPGSSYETPLVDLSIWIKSSVLMAVAGLKSEPKNIEYRTAECRRMESLCSVRLMTRIGRIPYFDTCPPLEDSTFSIRHSLLLAMKACKAEVSLLIKLAAPRQEAALTPDTNNTERKAQKSGPPMIAALQSNKVTG